LLTLLTKVVHQKISMTHRSLLTGTALSLSLLFGSTAKSVVATPSSNPLQRPLVTAQSSTANEAENLLEAGNRFLDKGDPRQALPLYQQALAGYRQAGDRPGEGTALTNLGITYYRLGRLQDALDSLQPAVTIHETYLKDLAASSAQNSGRLVLAGRERLRLSYRTIGQVYSQLGQYAKALQFYEQALARGYGRSIGAADCAWDSIVLSDMGSVHAKQKNYTYALRFYRRTLDIIEEVGYVTSANPTSLRRLSLCFTNLNNILATGLRPQDEPDPKAYDPFKFQPWARAQLVISFTQLGDVYAERGPSNKSREFYLQALKFSRLVDNRLLQGQTLNRVGQMYIDRVGNLAAGLELYTEALKISQETGDRALEGNTLHLMGKALVQAGRSAEAIPRLQGAIKAWESLRPGLVDEDQVAIFDTQAETYRLLQRALVAQKNPEAALETAERGRARAFVELLSRRITPIAQQQAPAPPTLQQIKQIAQTQNATLVTYSVITDSLLYVWVVQPNGTIRFEEVNLTQNRSGRFTLAQYVDGVRSNGLGVRGRGTGTSTKEAGDRTQASELQQLHQSLIQPIAANLPKEPSAQVIIIPQGELFLIPFAALQDAEGKYLIERHTLTIAPSIQVLDLTRQQRLAQTNNTSSQALIVGNPTMPKVILRAGEPPEPLSELPGAEQEARSIAALLNTQPLTGNQATKQVVKQQMPQAQVIHLATHGLLDDFKGLGTPGAIALAPTSSTAAQANSGLLTADEILDLPLRANLVVLSACDTGRGRITGDGVIGLSRALITAGTPSVVVSLWAVPDAPTATLMTQFYQNYLTTPNKAQALRQAMLTTLKQYPDPVNWAAFTLVGEAQ
jgi:CHAT domain-containing protein